MDAVSISATLPTSIGANPELLQHKLEQGGEASVEALQDFEAMFLSMMLKQMRSTIGGEGLFAGDASDTYGSMFDMFMGQHLAQTGGLGISQMLETYTRNGPTGQDS